MGLLRRIFPRKADTNRVLKAVEFCSGDFHEALVGESHYQDELLAIAGDRLASGRRVEFRALLMPEPENKFDSNAVAVYAEGRGIVGYLAREVAEEYQAVIQAHVNAGKGYPCCNALAWGGTQDKPAIGVWLDIDWDALEQTV
jgi:hypothetical protein